MLSFIKDLNFSLFITYNIYWSVKSVFTLSFCIKYKQDREGPLITDPHQLTPTHLKKKNK